MPADILADALNAAGISLRRYTPGTHRAACPKCKKPKDDALSVTIKDETDAVWNCHRCNLAGSWRPRTAAVPLRLTINGAAYEYGREAPMRTKSEVAATAQAVWTVAPQADGGHPYLLKKDVLAHGLKQQDGYLLVPMRDIAGELHSIQRIDASGGKLFPKDGLTATCFHLLGIPNGTLYICEGYATAATIHEATGDAVVVAFCADNLLPVASAWRLKLPNARIIVAADNDHETPGNPGVARAQAAAVAVGGAVTAPDIADLPDGGSDWNDVAAHIGMHQIVERLARQTTAQDYAVDKRIGLDAGSANAEADTGVSPDTGAQDCAPQGLPIVTYANAKPLIDAPYLVKGWILARELSVLDGAPGCGKTFMALDLDAHIAAGIDWFGHRVRQSAVVYLAAEGGTGIFNRIEAIRLRFGYDESLPLAIIPAGVDLVSGLAGPAAVVVAIKRAEVMFGMPVGKITIDTVSRVLAGADENSSEAMGGLIKAVDAIRAASNAHLTLIHHLPKDGTKGRGGRGHSSLWGAIDTEIGVDRDIVTKIATASVLKQRNAEEGASVSFELDIVPLGTDQDGDAVSSCVIMAAEAPRTTAGTKLSPACSLHLAALRLAISEGGQPVPASRYTPANATGVPVELWRKFAYERAISDGGATQDAKRKSFKRAGEQLQAHGLIGAWDGWVWIP